MSLTLRFNGSTPQNITAADQTSTVFSGIVNPGATFSFSGSIPNDKFVGPNVSLTVNAVADGVIPSLCGSVFVGNVYGSFTIAAAVSKTGGALCCSTATETIPPVITGCPANFNISLTPSSCQVAGGWTIPIATDNCTVASFTTTRQPTDLLPIGPTTVTYTAVDRYGNTSNCSFQVTVKDNTPPVFSNCPSDITMEAQASCQTTVPWTAPTATDNCSATLSTSHAPGSVFPFGTTLVTYTATDPTGNVATCSFNVIVKDTQAPVIVGCPANITMEAQASCQATASWTPPSATDNCTNILSTTHAPGAVFPFGTTLVTYTATDPTGNTATCSFNVIVKDTQAPVIVGCPADITIEALSSCQATASWTPPSATDNCSATVSTTHAPGAVFPFGTTLVTYTATDPTGNAATCSFNVIVSDTQAPVMVSCPTDITMEAQASCQTPVTWTPPSASDNCSATLSTTHTPGTVFPFGTTLVTYTATDPTGNTATCSFNVIVTDTQSPVIVGCPADITMEAQASCQATASWTAPSATDNCTAILSTTHASGVVFPFGTTLVTYTATDPSGNVATCSFNVIVSDTQAPLIVSCPTDITIEAQASCQATASWTPPSTSDNCTATLSSTHAPGAVFPFGTTLVTYTATDPTGNAATCSFNVIVRDTQVPSIVGCPSDITIEAQSSCQAIVSWTVPSATDNCSATLSTTNAPGAAFPFGTTLVTYTATDPTGNVATCSFNVIVRDTQAPAIVGCPSDITIEAQASCQAIVSWTVPSVSDNCSATLSGSLAPGAVFPLGTTPVTYTATDQNGNVATCSFNVIVRDTQAPGIFGCPSDIEIDAQASCQATVSWTVPSVSDNCSATLSATHTPGAVFPSGTTQVTYTATDPTGNTAVCTFNVIVTDTHAPLIAGCPQDITVNADACDAVASWTAPTATDECTVTLTASHQPGSTFLSGTTIVTYTATDGTGLTSTCSFKVIVKTGKAPVIQECPEDITIHTYDETVPVMWDAPQATPACGSLSVSSSHQPGTAFSPGITEVAYEFQDRTGNKSTCKFNVTVIHEEVTFEVSKAVTPNGDGINDTWWLTDIEKFNDNVVTVTDRWGNRIYESSGYDNVGVVWSALGPGGNKVPVGTYFYAVEVRAHGFVVRRKGFVEVIY